MIFAATVCNLKTFPYGPYQVIFYFVFVELSFFTENLSFWTLSRDEIFLVELSKKSINFFSDSNFQKTGRHPDGSYKATNDTQL